MRSIIFVAIVLAISSAYGAPSKKAANKKSKLTQDAVFDGSVVHGKYQMAGGAVAAVENEKTLNDIIGGRKDFKDRMRKDLNESKTAKSSATK